jgi:hypothetical protein
VHWDVEEVQDVVHQARGVDQALRVARHGRHKRYHKTRGIRK